MVNRQQCGRAASFSSESVYLNSPQSLSVLPSITCLRWQRGSPGCHAQTYTVSLTLKIGYDYEAMDVSLTVCD